MTIAKTLVGQSAALLQQIQGLVGVHPAGGDIRLLFPPAGLPMDVDEILVQVTDPVQDTVELHPFTLGSVALDDMLHGAQVSLLRQINAVVSGHPAGSDFIVLFAPVELTVADGAVLVQVLDPERRVVELRVRPLACVALDDVLHATQMLTPADSVFGSYAAAPPIVTCLMAVTSDGIQDHSYHG